MLVRMFATFAPSSCSTARLICTLFASDATWKTMVLPSSRRIEVFSVMSGRRMMSVIFIQFSEIADGRVQNADGIEELIAASNLQSAICNLRSAISIGQSLLQFLEGGPRRDDAIGVHHVARRDPAARDEGDAADVAHRALELLVA